MLRKTMLALADNDFVTRTVTSNRISRDLAFRFVAGETFDESLASSKDLLNAGMMLTLDLLGENLSEPHLAEQAATEYCTMLDRIAETGANSTISVKLTMLGLDISDEFAHDLMIRVLDRARIYNNFVRIDMEGSAYTQRTLDIFYALRETYGDTVGIVLQSYLYRNDRDVEQAIEQGAKVRLVKGAYAEPETHAYPKKADVDAAFRRQMERLMDDGNYPAIATQDDAIIDVARGYAMRMGIDKSRFEFQMMYGIREDIQYELVEAGYNMRVYVPFGEMWYPYFMRRMGERPANLMFALKNFVR
ncbi:MAG: proline dehydrogenase [Sphaerobacteraceae bacterium]|nr:MAG: proline dehydrogenase [Sphaerobacteraceae bacterium]